MKILFLTKYTSKGANSRYRSYNYKKWFEKEGVEASYSPLFNDFYFRYLHGNILMKNMVALWCMIKRVFYLFFHIQKYDHVVIEYELFPKLPLGFELFFLKKIKSFSLDFDDNISANYAGTSLQNKIPELMKLAKFVTVGNHWYISEFQGNLIYLPTVIDLDKYPLYSLQKENDAKEIVWMGSPSTTKHFKLVDKALGRLSEKYDFTLKVIGGKVELDKRIKTKFEDWSAQTENKDLAESTIGIMPLENSYWEMGKCGFKLIQYMASGIPVVASPLPANRGIVTSDVGFTAESEDEWYEKLSLLLESFELRQKMGQAGRKRVEESYSYQVWGKKYVELLKNNI